MSSMCSVMFQEAGGENQLSEVFYYCYNDLLLSNLVWWKVSLPMAGGWNDTNFKVKSNPNQSIMPLCKVFQKGQKEKAAHTVYLSV